MTTTTATRPGIMLPPPPMKYPVDVKVVGNDPAQKVSVNGRTVGISGTARNNGIVPSFMQFTIEGKKYNVQLSRGMSPMQTMQALQKQLPSGFEVQLLSTPRPGNAVNFQVNRTPATNTVERIREAFGAGASPGTQAGTKISKAELQAALREGLADDGKLSDGEKSAFVSGYMSLFTGAGFHATDAAQREFSRLAEKYGMQVPHLPLR